MSTATLNGHRCLAVRVHVPAWGIAFADVELDEAVPLSGGVGLVLADLAFCGTILSGGSWQGRSSYRLAAGAGGWGKRLAAKEYRTDAGVKLATVLGDAAREAGETIADVPAAVVGRAFERLEGPASACLNLLQAQSWYVGLDGVTRLGRRDRVEYTGKATRGQTDFASGSLDLMADAIADMVPGVVVEGLEAVDVVHELRDAKLRTRIWGSARSTTKRLAAWAALLEQLRPLDRYRGTYEYRVVSQSGDRLDLQPARASLGVPNLRSVRVRYGVPGCKAMHALGSLVLVAFVNADPGRAVVVGFDDPESPGFMPSKVTIDATSEVNLGASPRRAVACAGDMAGPFAITALGSTVKAGL